MATTSPDNIRHPNDGDQYALVQDLGVMADTVQSALVRRANSYVGTAAQRAAFTTAVDGTHWQDTTAPYFEYVRRGGAWVPADGSLPESIVFGNPNTAQVLTSAAGIWADRPHTFGTTTFGVLPRPLDVVAFYTNIGIAPAPNEYVSFGVATTGGLVTVPNGGEAGWGQTPFNTGTNIPATGFKRFTLPAGSSNVVNFKAQALRSSTAGGQVNYWQVMIQPMRWAG